MLMLKKWLIVIGIGEDGVEGLSAIARSLLAQAEIIVGGDRHLAKYPHPNPHQVQIRWENPIDITISHIMSHRGKACVCILASGDPFWFGIGTTLIRHIPIAEMIVIPAISTFSLICARLGWSLNTVETLSLCGRPTSILQSYIYPQGKLLILSAGSATPQQVAQLLCDRGFPQSLVTILEHLGGSQERIITLSAHQYADFPEFKPLNAIAVECIADRHAPWRSRMAGLPDSAYNHDGQLTKREVRAITLSTLAPNPGELLWDVGAGCGSIAIEWMLSHPRCQAIAIEKLRTNLIADNALALGTPNIQIIAGKAPTALQGLPQPDAIFIGGGITTTNLLETCWQSLRDGGRIVANAVTLEGEHRLWQAQKTYGGDLTQIAISHAEAIGSFLGWKPMRPVTQWYSRKI
jgi:precorrin-6Y C5,15-methyltransferase (decarboxylating)